MAARLRYSQESQEPVSDSLLTLYRPFKRLQAIFINVRKARSVVSQNEYQGIESKLIFARPQELLYLLKSLLVFDVRPCYAANLLFLKEPASLKEKNVL